VATRGIEAWLAPMRPAKAQEAFLRRFAELDDHPLTARVTGKTLR
jgi:hypothetical protein